MSCPPAALALVERFERFMPLPYDDGYGFATVGWGHRILAGEDFSAGLTRAAADRLLAQDLGTAEAAVARLCPVALTDNQRGALISFAFNAGAGTLQRATFRQCLLRRDYADVPAGLMKYVWSAGRRSRGLVRRRRAEAELFAR
jgi:lysozyme